MALNEYALITWAFAKSMLDYDDEDQVKAEFLINAASIRASKIAGRKLSYISNEDYFQGTGTDTLLLSLFPVNKLNELRIDASRVFGDDTIVTEYEVDEDAGILHLLDSVFPEGRKTVKIIYTTGYSKEPGVDLIETPSDLQSAILEIVRWNWGRFQGSNFGIKGSSVDGVNTSFEITVPLNARQIIEGYGCRHL